MEPFERGYGHTLGNALRRILLSSMNGFAPTEVSIAGVVHEYSTLDGVQEDVVDILLNLKGVVFKLNNRDDVVVTLNKEGEGPVTAADLELSHEVEVVNPDHVIAHITVAGWQARDGRSRSRRGAATCPATCARSRTTIQQAPSARILLDASFSPVRRVSYTGGKSARVEQRTDLDQAS